MLEFPLYEDQDRDDGRYSSKWRVWGEDVVGIAARFLVQRSAASEPTTRILTAGNDEIKQELREQGPGTLLRTEL